MPVKDAISRGAAALALALALAGCTGAGPGAGTGGGPGAGPGDVGPQAGSEAPVPATASLELVHPGGPGLPGRVEVWLDGVPRAVLGPGCGVSLPAGAGSHRVLLVWPDGEAETALELHPSERLVATLRPDGTLVAESARAAPACDPSAPSG